MTLKKILCVLGSQQRRRLVIPYLRSKSHIQTKKSIYTVNCITAKYFLFLFFFKYSTMVVFTYGLVPWSYIKVHKFFFLTQKSSILILVVYKNLSMCVCFIHVFETTRVLSVNLISKGIHAFPFFFLFFYIV